MVQQVETTPVEASETAQSLMNETEAPASPASLWTSESRVHYSITHTDATRADQRETPAWIDCDCVIHND